MRAIGASRTSTSKVCALDTLMISAWDVPVLIAAEFETAGFVSPRVHPTAFATVVVAHRP